MSQDRLRIFEEDRTTKPRHGHDWAIMVDGRYHCRYCGVDEVYWEAAHGWHNPFEKNPPPYKCLVFAQIGGIA